MLLNLVASDFATLGIPILLVALAYALLYRRRKKPLTRAAHYAFRISLAILLVWAAKLIWVVGSGDGWSRLVLMSWFVRVVPVTVVSWMLVWSLVALILPEGPSPAMRRRVAIAILGLMVLVTSFHVYRENLIYAPAASMNTEEAELRRLADSMWAKYDDEVPKKIAFNAATPVDLLTRLAQHSQYGVRINVCNNRQTPAPVLELLADDRTLYTRYCIAAHPNASTSLLARFASDPDESLRYVVAGNRNTPGEVLDRLSQDARDNIRVQVAGNPAAEQATVDRLSRDRATKVREFAAHHENLSREARFVLARDPSVDVRRGVLSVAMEDPELLMLLSQDEDENIQRSAKYYLQRY